MKKQIFGQCDKCIGITPCRVLKDGTVVCEYCSDEVKLPNVTRTSAKTDSPLREQLV